MIRKEADVNVLTGDTAKWTPLHAAADKGFASIITILLEAKANVKAQDHEDNSGRRFL